MKLLLIDNSDSFTYNLYHQLVSVTGLHVDIVNYDILDKYCYSVYDAYIISAGPGAPEDYPKYEDILRSGKPVFGVCLGMQIINYFFGGRVSRLDDAQHGITVKINYRGEDTSVAVYNSLYCSEVSPELEVYIDHGTPMWLMHKEYNIAGVQFHPESFMTEKGDEILEDVLCRIGIIQQ